LRAQRYPRLAVLVHPPRSVGRPIRGPPGRPGRPLRCAGRLLRRRLLRRRLLRRPLLRCVGRPCSDRCTLV